MTTPLPAEPGTGESEALSGRGPTLHGRLGGPDFTQMVAAAQAAGEAAADYRAVYRPPADVGDSLPPRKDSVTGLPRP